MAGLIGEAVETKVGFWWVNPVAFPTVSLTAVCPKCRLPHSSAMANRGPCLETVNGVDMEVYEVFPDATAFTCGACGAPFMVRFLRPVDPTTKEKGQNATE